MSDTYHPSSFSIRSASLNLMYVSSLQLYNNTYFTYYQEGNIKNIRILRRYNMQIPGKYADWQQGAPPIFDHKWGENTVMPSVAVLFFIRRYINKAEPLNNEFRLLKVRFEM